MKIDDIARLAQVSKSAVSLALNGKPGVSEETRATILKIAEDYHYVPLRNVKKKETNGNRIIRFVACKNSDIVTDNYESMPFFNELLGYLTSEMKNYPFSLLITSVQTETLEEELNALEEEQTSDGILLLGTNLTAQQIERVKKIQPNIVVLDTCIPQMNCDFIAIDNYQGAYEAGLYLLQNGHTNIGYARAQTRIYNFKERERGLKKALDTHGVSIHENHCYEFPAMDIQTQVEKFSFLARKDHLPTAIFCDNDYIAISLIKTLNLLNIQVPKDISIIGFDNISEAKVVIPELTTIHVPKEEIAREALKRIIGKIQRPQTDIGFHAFIGTKLIERSSCTKF